MTTNSDLLDDLTNDRIQVECLICGQPHNIDSYYPAGDACDNCLDLSHQPTGMTYYEHIVTSDDEDNGPGFIDYDIRRNWNLPITF